MYVCICKAVTDQEIRRAAADGADSLFELQSNLGVATGCGTCADYATAILDEEIATKTYPSPTLYVPSAA